MWDYTMLRKQYYTAFDVPFCKCGGCWHYDKDLRGFVCEECGRPVPVIDITRHTKPLIKKEGFCLICGKKLTGKQRKYCSIRCKHIARHDKERETIFNYYDFYLNENKYRIEDDNNHFINPSFTENDNNWGLGESNLYEHSVKDKTREKYYIKKELKRIKSRKPNP